MGNVRETWWAAKDEDRHAFVADAIPAALETEFHDWQHRVDAPDRVDVGSMRYLRVITATMKDGETRTYLVVADSLRAAWDRVAAQVKAHGGELQSLCAPEDGAIMVLEG